MINVENLKPFPKFCYTIGMIPTSYKESLTYEEQLWWFCDFLQNTVIPTVNNNGQAVEELQNLYIELKSYVDNYFTNLDVQQEINNKLDEMAESGKLTDIIAQYLGLAGMLTFNTVSEMKLAQNLANGSICKTLGYHNINDGGNATYKIREITNQDTVDNTSIISLNNENLIAELIYNNVNLISFGCYGDGIHDDTNALKNAINFAYEHNVTVISPSNKSYLLSSLVVFPDVNINLSMCTFKTDYGIKITATNKELSFPKVEAVSELSANNAIELFECYTNKIYVPFIHNFTTGLILTANENGCVYNNITIQEICNCITSLKLYPTNTGWINENMFIGGRLWQTGSFTTAHGADTKIIHLQGNANSTCNNNYFLHQCVEGNEGSLNGVKIKLEHTNWCIFEDLRYEGTNAKVDITNSLYNVLNNGYGINSLTFVNDTPIVNSNGISTLVTNAGSIGGTNSYIDAYMSGNTRASVQTRRTTGTIANRITPNGITTCDNSNNETLRFNEEGMQSYYNDTWNYIFRRWNKFTLIPKCDLTNTAIVINDGTNVNNGCFLWIYDNHLYGKMGQPSSQSDGSIIL